MGSINMWQPLAHSFWSCSVKRWRVVPPAVAGLAGGTLGGGGGNTPHNSLVYTALPRLTGLEPSGEPVRVKKLGSINRPRRCEVSSMVLLKVMLVAALPYTLPSVWLLKV